MLSQNRKFNNQWRMLLMSHYYVCDGDALNFNRLEILHIVFTSVCELFFFPTYVTLESMYS